jgi:hypothetical protein
MCNFVYQANTKHDLEFVSPLRLIEIKLPEKYKLRLAQFIELPYSS